MINDGKSTPVKFVVVNAAQPQLGMTTPPTVDIKDIKVMGGTATFELAHGGRFDITVDNLVTGLHINVTASDVLLSYAFQQPQQYPMSIHNPAMRSSVAQSIENRAVALVSHPMTLPLLEAMRQVVSPVAKQEGSNISAVTFETPLRMACMHPGQHVSDLVIVGYQLCPNRDVILRYIEGPSSLTNAESRLTAHQWREHMSQWMAVGEPTHEHQILLSIIKPRGQAPQDKANDVQPRNTAGEYHGRSGEVDTTPEQTPDATDTPTLYLSGQGVQERLWKTPVHSYQVIDQEDQKPLAQFFNEEGAMLASAPLNQLALSRYRQSITGLLVEIVPREVTSARRTTLINHAEQHGAEALANALRKLKN